jgi:hypothetical protein
MKNFTLTNSESRNTPHFFFSEVTRIQTFAIIATLHYRLIISKMTTISSSLSHLGLEDGPSDYSKNARSPKEEPVDEEAIFRKFKKLPIEVRLMIWKELCFEPRTIDIRGKPISIHKLGVIFDIEERDLWSMKPDSAELSERLQAKRFEQETETRKQLGKVVEYGVKLWRRFAEEGG